MSLSRSECLCFHSWFRHAFNWSTLRSCPDQHVRHGLRWVVTARFRSCRHEQSNTCTTTRLDGHACRHLGNALCTADPVATGARQERKLRWLRTAHFACPQASLTQAPPICVVDTVFLDDHGYGLGWVARRVVCDHVMLLAGNLWRGTTLLLATHCSEHLRR